MLRHGRPPGFLFTLLSTLIALASTALAQTPPRRTVAILVWPGAELLDFTGRAEVFAAAGRHRLFSVHIVGLDRNPVRTQGSVTVQPDFTLADCPKPDVLVIPGGKWMEYRGYPAAKKSTRAPLNTGARRSRRICP